MTRIKYNIAVMTTAHKTLDSVKIFVTMPSNQQPEEPSSGYPNVDPRLVKKLLTNMYNRTLMDGLSNTLFRKNINEQITVKEPITEQIDVRSIVSVGPL
jgi:hypothetical protein